MAEENWLGSENDVHGLSAAGIHMCRTGHWEEGLKRLRHVAQVATANDKLPGLFYSYLGYGLADRENKYKQGISLCKLGTEVGLFEAETYLLLAKTYMLLDRKKAAIDALDRGLKVDRDDRRLRTMRGSFGIRKPVPIPFLPRGHFLNRCYGELRETFMRRREVRVRASVRTHA